jgi:hypothetical protein
MSQPITPDVLGAQDQKPPSISSTPSQPYQAAMQQQASTPPVAHSPTAQSAAADLAKDVVMTDSTPNGPAVSPWDLLCYRDRSSSFLSHQQLSPAQQMPQVLLLQELAPLRARMATMSPLEQLLSILILRPQFLRRLLLMVRRPDNT